jgi:serine/threonine-protein kinase HipA
MRVGTHEADSSLENALSMCSSFALRKDEAVKEVRRVAKVVAGWEKHFLDTGVSRKDVAMIAEQIERPFLRDQRQAAKR